MSVADDILPARTYDARLMRRLLVYLRPHVTAIALAGAAILVSSLVDLAQPWLTQQAIDKYIASGDAPGLARMAVFFFVLIVVGFLAEYGQTFILQTTGQRIMHRMRTEVYAHLQRLELRYYDRHPVGRLMTRVTTDVDALNDLFASGVIAVFGDLLVLVGIMVAMLLMNWRLALVAFSVLPFILWTAHWFRTNVRESYRRVRGLVARLNAFLQEHLTGMSVVQVFNQEDRTARRFDAINREHRDVNIASIFYYALFYPLIELLAAISGALIIWYGTGWAEQGTLTIGVLVAFLQYSRRFFQPISDLSEKFNILQAAMAASERIFGVLDTEPALVPPRTPIVPREARGRIEFDHVWFAYDDEHFVLKDVSFVIEPGKRVGIVGATGSGKTTIINLLLRFYDIQRGRILVDGVDVREWDVPSLRRLFGLVLQDVHLFSGTIADNIRLGDASITDDQIVRAAQAVHAHGFITARTDGYASVVGERGGSLSVGQKQLLSFARALAFDPQVLLLDEATSSVDTATEALIEDALHVIMEGRTVLAVAHRLSTIQDMDAILVLHKGELREHGTHQQLVAARGLYYRLYELQYANAVAG
ncbi:MAG TPA: ABC transporter ATP-binding protein [Vicinamibacterales bacterium]|nr:ABC transporter ATP-binding protein [Vicinamibacterales bacterium]